MRRVTALLLVLITTPALGTAGAFAARIVKVGPRANGTSIGLRGGDTLVVSLPGNPTTGFRWTLRALDQTVVKRISTRYVPKKPIRAGSGGTFVFRFRALVEGKTTLKLVYARPGQARAAKTYTLRLRVLPLPE